MTLNLSRRTHSRDPQPPPTVKDVQIWLNRKGSNPVLTVDGDFGPKTEAAVIAFQRRAGFGQDDIDGIVGPQTWSKLSELAPPVTVNRRGRSLAALAYQIVTGGYRGGKHPAYVFGAENDLMHPERVAATDCAELVQVCVSYLTGHPWVDGSRWQYNATQHISVAQAIQIPGALLFHTRNGAGSGVHHVAVSLGDGRTAEARNSRVGTGVWSATGRFNLAGLVPGFNYASGPIRYEDLMIASNTLDEEVDPALPTMIDGIPFDHVGDLDEPEDHPDVPPFDIDQELAEINQTGS